MKKPLLLKKILVVPYVMGLSQSGIQGTLTLTDLRPSSPRSDIHPTTHTSEQPFNCFKCEGNSRLTLLSLQIIHRTHTIQMF